LKDFLRYKPTVGLDVIALAANSCGYDSGTIKPLVAQELAVY